jgi:hypothetical protein
MNILGIEITEHDIKMILGHAGILFSFFMMLYAVCRFEKEKKENEY